MRVLVACEFSGIVRDSFTALGHDSWSCDVLPTEREGNHFQCDVRAVLGLEWDLLVAHPPCTYLCNSGVCWLHKDLTRWDKMRDGAEFFKMFLDADIPRICVENPVMHKYAVEIVGRRQSQVIQPYMFGHPERKATGLWLKNLPALIPTNNVRDAMERLPKNQRERLHYLPPSVERWKLRSNTFQGIASAMAAQWGNLNPIGGGAFLTAINSGVSTPANERFLMSAKLTGQVWELDLPHKKQSVLLALADNAHDDGTNCYPGVDYLAWKTGYDRRSVQRILRELERDGLVVPVTGASGGRSHELEYRIDLSKGVRKTPWKEVKAGKGKRAAKCHPLSDTKGGDLSPFTEEKGRQIEQERAASVQLKGGKSNTPPSIPNQDTEPRTKHTHTAAPAPTQGTPERDGHGVCACAAPHRSKLCDDERIRIAKNTPGVKLPENYAMAPEARRGTYDAVFLKRKRELEKPGAPSARDTSACPDCKGRNLVYPAGDTAEGRARGVTKCLHPRLDLAPEEEREALVR